MNKTEKKDAMRMDYMYRKEWKTKDVTMQELCALICGTRYLQLVKAVRGEEVAMTSGGYGTMSLAASDLPKLWPALCGDGSYTGRVLLTMRMEGDHGRLLRLKRRVSEMPHVEMAAIGSSGQSLKIVMRYALDDGSLPTETQALTLFQQYAYRRACDFLLASTGMKADDDAHYGTGYMRLTHDADVFWNTNATAIRMPQPSCQLTDLTAPLVAATEGSQLEHEVLPGYSRLEMDMTKLNIICRNMSFEAEREPDSYLLTLAAECRRAGIDREVAVKCVLVMDEFRGRETLVRSTFDNAYNGHRLGRRNPLEPTMMHQQLMREYLRQRYNFRRNTVTGDVEYQEKGRYLLSWHTLTAEMRNTINNQAIDLGIRVWPRDMDRMLGSTEVADYDPVAEWLAALPEWDGRDRLGELARRVPTATPEWEDDFRVWMRSVVSQWMGRNRRYGAQMVLMLLGGQGTHKSTFLRMLMPQELLPYYIDRIDFANKGEALRALSRFLLINMDEYDQITPAQTAYLKHLIQRTDVVQRKMYETTYQQQQRYAAFCATTNSLLPLRDDTGSRRYLVVEVTGIIDTDCSGPRQIDYQQLYAQVVSDIMRGEDCYFDGERERRIVKHNEDFQLTPAVVQHFEDLFRQPTNDEEVLMLSPMELLHEIARQRKVRVETQRNAIIIGNYLKTNGYQKCRGDNRRRYAVARRNAS